MDPSKLRGKEDSNRVKKKYKSNQVIVNNKSNFKSHLVRCQNILDNLEFDHLILKGMGKAQERAVNIANQLNENNFNTFEISTTNYIVDILEEKSKKPFNKVDYDQFDPDDDSEVATRISPIAAIEIKVKKSQLEIDKLKQLKKLDASLRARR